MTIKVHHVAALAFLSFATAVEIGCTKALGALGDDCTADAGCNSGLCDDKMFCATPVATSDGKPCTTDATCPAGDHCHAPTGKCFSNASDGLGGNNACNGQSDCGADETCVKHVCQG